MQHLELKYKVAVIDARSVEDRLTNFTELRSLSIDRSLIKPLNPHLAVRVFLMSQQKSEEIDSN